MALKFMPRKACPHCHRGVDYADSDNLAIAQAEDTIYRIALEIDPTI